MIQMLAGQFLTPAKLAKAANDLTESLKKHPLEPGELLPLMVINPAGGKLSLDIIVMKMDGEKMVYSRRIDSKEMTAEYLVKALSGISGK